MTTVGLMGLLTACVGAVIAANAVLIAFDIAGERVERTSEVAAREPSAPSCAAARAWDDGGAWCGVPRNRH